MEEGVYMSEDRKLDFQRSKLKLIGKTLVEHFSKNEGIVMGNSAVVSRSVHLEPRQSPGTVNIYPSRDAGITYMKMVETNQVVHIDVLHHPAEINIYDLANRVHMAIANYLDLTDTNEKTLWPEQETLTLNLAQRILLRTAGGEGTVINPVMRAEPPGGLLHSHIHILAKLPQKFYGLVYCLVEQAEKAIVFQGYRLRHVNKIVHVCEEEDESSQNFR